MVIEDRELKPLGVATDYPSLHAALRARVAELGIKLSSIDEAGLLPDAQSSKLLSQVPRRVLCARSWRARGCSR